MEITAIAGETNLVVDVFPEFIYRKEGSLLVGKYEPLYQFSRIDSRCEDKPFKMEDGSIENLKATWTENRLDIPNLIEITLIEYPSSRKMIKIFIDKDSLEEISGKVLNYGWYEFQNMVEMAQVRRDAKKYRELLHEDDR